MQRGKLKFNILIVAIILGVILAVNVGWTFALSDPVYRIDVGGKHNSKNVSTYLNDVVVSNSTQTIPIAYRPGAVTRQISFDYSFTENTDVAIEFKLLDGESAFKDAEPIISNRDDYILDCATESLQNSTTEFISTNEGTLYYVPMIKAGHGTQVVFTGIYFHENSDNVGKTLTIELSVHTKANVSETSKTATDYYSTSHYFNNFSKSTGKDGFNAWLDIKKATDKSETIKIPANKVLIYNSHPKNNGMPYKFDFATEDEMKEASSSTKSDITSAYIYSSSDNKFYSYAGGNKYYGGVGVYYMAASSCSLKVSVGVNWFKNGEIQSSAPISNVNLIFTNDFQDLTGNAHGYKYTLPANSFGYIDILDCIEMTTIGNIYDLKDCTLVITSITAELTSTYEEGWVPTTRTESNVKVLNSTSSSPVLFKYASNIGLTSTIKFDVSVVNDTDQPMSISALTLTPKFYTYNGQTGTGDLHGIAKTNYLTTDENTKFIYNTDMWDVTTGTAGTGGAIPYTFKSKSSYIAPHSEMKVISGLTIAATNKEDWSFTLDDTKYYADYWFTLDMGTITTETATTTSVTKTSEPEFMTILTDTTIKANESTYIGIRNNTTQTMTSFTINLSLANIQNNSSEITFSCEDYSSSALTTETKNITCSKTGINLNPGESVILFKLSVSAGENVGITSYSADCSLGETPTHSSTYLKVDLTSKNMCVINPSETNAKLTLTNYITGDRNISSLVGGTEDWEVSDSNAVYKGILRGGQIMLISNSEMKWLSFAVQTPSV